MKKPFYLFAGLALFIGVSQAHAWPWRDTYDDCIIKNISENMPDNAVPLVQLSCGRKHFDTADHDLKIIIVESDIENYKQTDPEFYNWFKKSVKYIDNSPYGSYSRIIIKEWVDKHGFPKR